ncbi:MAG: hypothetical protein MUP30_08305 [Deltaproteobacteria bacterium]|nr:hypothetical protein [Deltaproteobacteria bacterium]
MDKEELHRILGTSHLSEWCAIMYAAIALVEIRESIDDLRASIEQLNKDIHPPCPIDQGKDIRSAGLG